MVAGRVGCGDGAGWCKISMGWWMMGYAHVAGGLGSCFRWCDVYLAISLGGTAMEVMVRRSTLAMMSIQRVFKRLGQKFRVSD
jgi:hypothetical protein